MFLGPFGLAHPTFFPQSQSFLKLPQFPLVFYRGLFLNMK